MMRSLYSGVSGLTVHQTKMDVIGNNIANVNTVGFKSSRATFSEVFSQTVSSATGPGENSGGTNPMQIGLGASLGSIDVNMTEGAAQRTDNPLDLKIEGDGFFVVSDTTGNKFTRAGAFGIDEVGNLVTSDGMWVMGWPVDDTTGQPEKATVEPIAILSGENLYSDPVATSYVTMSGNINQNDDALGGTGIPFTAQFYDSLGYSYTAEFAITGGTPGGTAPNEYYEFTIGLAANSITDSEGNSAGLLNDPVSRNIRFDINDGKIVGSPDPATNSFLLTGLATDFSTFGSGDITFEFDDLTMFSGNSTVEAVAGDSDGLRAGSEAGSISGYEVAGDGQVIGRYTNGDTKVLGQIVIANFSNPAGLQKVGDNLFEATVNSGSFDGIGEDITSGGGSFNAGVLEMSNVDLSREFTEMITTQRGFQANSRIITSSDEMLQELVNLKR